MKMDKAPETNINSYVAYPDLVGYSRAGDTFHYRWAARRCLRLRVAMMLSSVVLPAPFGPDKPDNLSRFNVKADIIHCNKFRKFFSQAFR